MSQIANGDESAFTQFFDATAVVFYGMALSVLGDASEAEDVTRNVYLELWRTAPRFDSSIRDTSAWIEHVAIRHVIARARALADGCGQPAVEAGPAA
jgi:RNA polymerase sigma-70 factor (ECF subfamily)